MYVGVVSWLGMVYQAGPIACILTHCTSSEEKSTSIDSAVDEISLLYTPLYNYTDREKVNRPKKVIIFFTSD